MWQGGVSLGYKFDGGVGFYFMISFKVGEVGFYWDISFKCGEVGFHLDISFNVLGCGVSL